MPRLSGADKADFEVTKTMNQIPMTLRGAEKLREELDFLKGTRRPQIIAAIAEAREHGDLKENASTMLRASSRVFAKAVFKRSKPNCPMPR